MTLTPDTALSECDGIRALLARYAPDLLDGTLQAAVAVLLVQRDDARRELRAMRTLAAEQARLRGAR